jgi:hypothetical protein
MAQHDDDTHREAEASMLTPAMRESGDWLSESATLKVTAFSRNWLRELRRKERVRALPETRGPSGQARTYWYFRSDVEDLVRRRSAGSSESPTTAQAHGAHTTDDNYLLRQLELEMSKSNEKELELALARSQAEVELTRLRGELALVRAQLAESDAKYQRTLAALAVSMGLSPTP